MFQDGTELQFLLFCFFVVLASLSVQVWNAVTGNLLSSTDTRSQVMQTCSDPFFPLKTEGSYCQVACIGPELAANAGRLTRRS